MQPKNNISAIDRMIDARERELAAAKQIRGFIVEFPNLIEELRNALAGPQRNGSPASIPPARKPGRPQKGEAKAGASLTNFQRVKQFFAMSANSWCSAPELAEALGLERGTVGHLLWKGHRDAFEQQNVPGSVKLKLWRLKPEVLKDFATHVQQTK